MTAADPSRLPVLIGLGQLRSNRERTVDGAREPADLIVDAAWRAGADAGDAQRLLREVDDLSVVSVISWAYDDLPGLLSARLGLAPLRHAEHGRPGGQTPVAMLDRCAARITAGESRMALVCSGEAVASLHACAAAGVEPPGWSRAPGGPAFPTSEEYASERMIRYGLTQPIRGYPLYENALRAALGQSFVEAQARSAEMYASFSRVAAENDAAWDPVVRTPEEIATPGNGNRMVCFPYPLRMNARMDTDQAAAALLTSLETARALGVAPERIVHVWGGAGAADPEDLLERTSYTRAPGMEASLRGALEAASVGARDLDVVDLYSCFPVVPKLAARFLGLPSDAELTATGGLTSFGGPVSGYSLHSVVAVGRRIRAGARLGIVYGNGEYLTKHHTVLLAGAPHERGYVGVAPPAEARDVEAAPPVVDIAGGASTVETFTVEFSRAGAPEIGYVIGRLQSGARFAAHAEDPATLDALTATTVEGVGRAGTVEHGADGRNRFRIPA